MLSVSRKYYELLPRPARRRFWVLFLLMLGGMLWEMLGLGLILPLLALMARAELPPAAQEILARAGNPGRETLLLWGAVGLGLVFLGKGLYLFFTQWRLTVFFTGIKRELCDRLFARYLSLPYAAHLRRNSAEMSARIEDVTRFADGLNYLLNLIAESLVLGGILALLLYVEPWGTLAAGGIGGGAMFLVFRLSRGYIRRAGEERLRCQILRQQHALQGLGGVKEIKLLAREGAFARLFASCNAGETAAVRRFQTVANLPRFCLEVLAAGSLAVLVAVLVWQGKSAEAMMPLLGLFAGAFFRVTPSVNRIVYAMQNLQYVAPSVSHLHAELAGLPPIAAEPRQAARADAEAAEQAVFSREISLRDVAFRYEGAPGRALDGITLTVAAGSSVGIIGTSGAGKSTLIDVILGLLPPEAGKILIDGVPLEKCRAAWQRQIGYVPQTIYLTDDTLRRNIAFGRADAEIDDAAVRAAARAAQLDVLIDSLPAGLETVIGERGARLSGGQRQRIGIARALYHNPAVLVLDEATSALDTATENEVLNAIRALHGRKTVITVAHRLNTVSGCDRLFRLENGKLADG